MAGKEIKLEDAISEIVDADSNWELGAEGSNVDYFEEEEEEEQQQLQASAKSNHRLQQVADYHPGDCLKEGTQIFIFCRSSQMWTMKLYFHLLDLTALNSWILLSACGAKYTDRDFTFLLMRNLIEEAEKTQDHPTLRLVVKTKCGPRKY